MSTENANTLHPSLALGDALPSHGQNSGAQHIYVSLADMISEHIFYHPGYESAEVQLSEIDQSSIDAIIGAQPLAEHFVSTMVEKITESITANHKAVRVSLSDSDSYMFRTLLGGQFEPEEINPALGLRGVSRFATESYSPVFALECEVVKKLRATGVEVEVVVPFVRTLSDAAKIIDLLAEQGLSRGQNGLKVSYCVDVPSSALLADKLLPYFDGVVVDIENLAQTTLGIDRYSPLLEYLFDADNDAVLQLVKGTIAAARECAKPALVLSSGLLGYPKLMDLLSEQGALDVVVTS
ncbi:pyruvate, water dikinase [Vibrio xiamenensis]|uniref:Pyruvate, water dikinase n=1 Tax=Vibrio xiamenensis TaxID=861298 RepID=A0A1G7YFD3_9VIBR|nr:putative PEP-binding protein [Vibrio xiamenensis]SDG95035.1 pyruvate, water dikinase [Vibrio xiamenensis]